MDELYNSGFWHTLVRWLGTLKMLAKDVKHTENKTRSEFFMTDENFGGIVQT